MNKALETVYKLVITKSITKEQFETLVKALLENKTVSQNVVSESPSYTNATQFNLEDHCLPAKFWYDLALKKNNNLNSFKKSRI